MDPETWNSLYYGSFAGLPVYTSKWMPGEMIVTDRDRLMTDRPYSNLTGSDLSRVLAEQIRAGGPVQPPAGTTLAATTGQNVETIFRVGPDGRPEAVTRLVDTPSKGAVRNGGESELAWLKRRVNEICWRL